MVRVMPLVLLPIVTAIFITGSLFITYGIAIGQNANFTGFPYISYTAIGTPQREVFAQLLNIGSLLLALNAYVRYLQIRHNIETCVDLQVPQHISRCNVAALISAFLSAFGLSMVANFQTKILPLPHLIGAMFAFFSGAVYCWIQAVITWKGFRGRRSLCVLGFRVFTCVCVTLLLLLFCSTKIIAKKNKKKWRKEKYLKVYLTSSISEWGIVAFILIFLITFVHEFKGVQIKSPSIVQTGSIYQRDTENEEEHQRLSDETVDHVFV